MKFRGNPGGIRGLAGHLVWPLAVWTVSSFKFLALCDSMRGGSQWWPQVLWSTILGALALSGLPLLLPRRVRPLGFVAVSALVSSLCLADLLYYRYYTDLFTVRSLSLAGQLGDVWDSVRSLFSMGDLLFLMDLPVLLAVALLDLRSRERDLRFRFRAAGTCLCLLGLLPFGFQTGIVRLRVPGYVRAMWDRPAVMFTLGPVGYHLADLINASSDLFASRAVAAQDEEALLDWAVKRRQQVPVSQRDSLHGAGKGLNLIVVQVEALQGFVMNLKVGGQEVTPNLNRLARRSLYFPNVYNQTGAGNTCDAEFMVQTSLFPSATGVAYVRFSGNYFESLPRILQRNGYETLSMHGNRASFWNRHRMHPALGFQEFFSKERLRSDEEIGLGLSDRSFFEQGARILSERKGPFYAFMVTLSSHHPFSFQGIPRTLKLDGSLEGTFLGDYLNAIHYADAQIGRFLQDLRRRGILDRSVLVVYGDHTAIPNANGSELEVLLEQDLKDPLRWRALQKVPLMIRLPKGRGARVVETTGGHVDIGPTVASIMGVNMPLAFGQDLLTARVGTVVFRNGTLIRGGVFVDPTARRAWSMGTLSEVPFDAYRDLAEGASEALRLSDLLLEKDMAQRVCERLP